MLLKSRNIAEPSVTKDYSALDEGDTIKSIAVSPYFLYRLEARERGTNGGIFVAPQNYRLAFCTLVWAQSLCFACSISKFVRIKTIILLENVICQKLTFFAISYKYRRERIIHDSKNWKKIKHLLSVLIMLKLKPELWVMMIIHTSCCLASRLRSVHLMGYSYWRSLEPGQRTKQELASVCRTLQLVMISRFWQHLIAKVQPSMEQLCPKLPTINQLSGSVGTQRIQGLFGTGWRSLPLCWKVFSSCV